MSPLFFAIESKKFDIVKYFLETKIFDVNCGHGGIILFEYVIKEGLFDIAEILLKHPSIKTISSFSYIMIKKNCCKYLLSEAKVMFFLALNETIDINVSYPINLIKFYIENSSDEKIEDIKFEIVRNNEEILTCLAVMHSNENDCTRFFDKFEIDICIVESKNKITPLIASIFNEKHDILDIILTKYDVDSIVNFKSISGLTVLHYLCTQTRSEREGVKKLLSLESISFNEQESTHQYAPIHLAVLTNNTCILKLLLNNPQVNVNIQCEDGNTPFHLILCKFIEISNYERLKLVELFFKHCSQNVDLTIKNKNGETPIQLYCNNNPKFMEKILPNDPDYNDYTVFVSIIDYITQIEALRKVKEHVKNMT